jgi:phosphoribosyl 1,2-cyclic phosphate phosphodiesterase
MSSVEITFLGTGTSNGIPVIGCPCAVCASNDPRDTRTRTSAIIHDASNARAYLIDTATELRLQALTHNVTCVDAVLMTHAHADHTGGFDDLRRFNELQSGQIPVYANTVTAGMLRERFAYAFRDPFHFFGGKPDLVLHETASPFNLFGRDIVPVPVFHGRMPILGYRIGGLAYITDAKVIPDSSLDLLHDLDVLVLNALRMTAHPTHLSLPEAVSIIERLQPKAAYLVHLSHELSHTAAEAALPPYIHVAYDGLTVHAGA